MLTCGFALREARCGTWANRLLRRDVALTCSSLAANDMPGQVDDVTPDRASSLLTLLTAHRESGSGRTGTPQLAGPLDSAHGDHLRNARRPAFVTPADP
jgi:hypothetical protein